MMHDKLRGLKKMKIATNATARRKGKVLVMDDAGDLREVITHMLIESRYRVCVARDGTEAIHHFKKAQRLGHPFDVVLLDIHVVEGMGGVEALVKLREIEAGVKAILLTGDINHPAVVNYETLGFKAAVIKPFTPRELLDVLSWVSTDGVEVH
jgi:CheY-like chemotaxis protein